MGTLNLQVPWEPRCRWGVGGSCPSLRDHTEVPREAGFSWDGACPRLCPRLTPPRIEGQGQAWPVRVRAGSAHVRGGPHTTGAMGTACGMVLGMISAACRGGAWRSCPVSAGQPVAKAECHRVTNAPLSQDRTNAMRPFSAKGAGKNEIPQKMICVAVFSSL